MEDKDKIQQLSHRLDQILRQQKQFQDEIQKIYEELQKLKARQVASISHLQPGVDKPERELEDAVESPRPQPAGAPTILSTPPLTVRKPKTAWEEFIGANLLNKIGIAVLVLGIGIGAKFSVDHDLINPSIRIILGYLAGCFLLALAHRLRLNHTSFSAVLLSGGMAVLYFITFAACSLYGMIPQIPAFVLMVILTAFTVLAALRYNLEVVGIIGLAGAYAVPLLLGDGSGPVVFLFSYIAIINGGILLIAFRKYWKRLFYTAFILTWLTFVLWFSFSFYREKLVSVSLFFSTIYLVTFYTIFLAYKLIRHETLGKGDILCMLFNSFTYFGFGYLAVSQLVGGKAYLGIFTITTAILHFVAVPIIYYAQKTLSDVFFFAAGMVLVFLTIAVPVQLDGSWVTVLWATEALLLFWIGRIKSLPTYEKLSYPLIAIAVISLLHYWSNTYPSLYDHASQAFNHYPIFLNVQFLTSMLASASLVAIAMVNRSVSATRTLSYGQGVAPLVNVAIPVLAILVTYTGFFKEIEAFWNYEYAASRVVINGSEIEGRYSQHDENTRNFKGIWLIMFSAVFGYVLYLSHLRLRSSVLLLGSLAFNAIVLFALMTAGLLDLSALRSSYLAQEFTEYYPRGAGHIVIRYIAFLVVLPLLLVNANLARNSSLNANVGRVENLYFHLFVLVLLSSELVHWLEMARVENTFKLSLSILWGAYALFMIVLGLSRDATHIRLGGMLLFAVTLLKLFVYDIAGMSAILKTVVMIVLGALLLVASFVYNRYKRPPEGSA